MNRRSLIHGLAIAPVAGSAFGTAKPSPAAEYDYPYLDYWSEESLRDRRNRLSIFGTEPALEQDIKQAEGIIAAAPTDSPVAVMNYFADLRVVGSTGERFNRRWRRYENLVIVWFFHATKTQPTGDCTSWCAAFLSWSLEQAGLKSKHSASSQAYLNFGTETKTPTLGDIVVFQNIDNKDRGHVALFLGETPVSVHILGGNQGKCSEAIPSCPPGFPATEIGREWRDKVDEHQRVVSYRRYSI